MPDNLVVGVIALVAGLLVGFGMALLVRKSIALNGETTARANADRRRVDPAGRASSPAISPSA